MVKGISVRISERTFSKHPIICALSVGTSERNFEYRLKKYTFPLQISEGIKNFLSKRVCIWAFPVRISEGCKYFLAFWVSKTAFPLQISEGIKIFLRVGCAKVVSKFLISEGVQIGGVIPNK